MITLYKFGPFLGTPDSSPFVIKTMVLLKLAGLEFKEVQGNPLRAPKKLLPYIDDAGTIVADSGFIRSHIERKYGFDFDAGLTAAQKAMAWTVERTCEDHLYFAMLESRWLDRRNFRRGVAKMFVILPLPIRPIAKRVLKRANAQRLRGHGLGRHSKSEISELGIRDLEALSALLGNKPYMMGDSPSGADAAVFGLVAAILVPPLDSPMRAAATQTPNLVAYCDRMMSRFFPSLEKVPNRR